MVTLRALFALTALVLSDIALGADAQKDNPFRGKIVLSSRLDAALLLQTMNPDGTGLQTVMKLEKSSSIGPISPDGRNLTDYRNQGPTHREIWLLGLNGERRKLADKGFLAAWSPDGRKIACYGGGRGDWENFTIDVATNEIRPLPIPKGDSVQDWSPDGHTLSVIAGNADKWFQHSTKGKYALRQIYLMNLDGTGRRMLTPESGYDSIWPRFSPDGKRVAHYRREYPNNTQSPIETLVLRKPDGADPKILLSFAKLSDAQISIRPFSTPIWSPDGRSLAWIADRRRRDPSDLFPGTRIQYELVFVSAENGAVKQSLLDQKGVRSWGMIDWR
jgi:Tol biopolymer transport system component